MVMEGDLIYRIVHPNLYKLIKNITSQKFSKIKQSLYEVDISKFVGNWWAFFSFTLDGILVFFFGNFINLNTARRKGV